MKEETIVSAMVSAFRFKADLVAQLVEQYTFNVWALGSSPSGITGKAVSNERSKPKP